MKLIDEGVLKLTRRWSAWCMIGKVESADKEERLVTRGNSFRSSDEVFQIVQPAAPEARAHFLFSESGNF